jgi:hypothetical protein
MGDHDLLLRVTRGLYRRSLQSSIVIVVTVVMDAVVVNVGDMLIRGGASRSCRISSVIVCQLLLFVLWILLLLWVLLFLPRASSILVVVPTSTTAVSHVFLDRQLCCRRSSGNRFAMVIVSSYYWVSYCCPDGTSTAFEREP